jgi:hypothetical protein
MFDVERRVLIVVEMAEHFRILGPGEGGAEHENADRQNVS